MSLVKLFRKKYKKTLFTTPSHNQRFFISSKFGQFYKFDISETDTHNPEEALLNAEQQASKIYGTVQTKFLTNGSTSGIIAAVLACCQKNDKVLIQNNSHPCHKNSVELASAIPVFYGVEKDNTWGVEKPVSTKNIEDFLKKEKIKALIITSPTYEGVTSNISELKEVCQKYGTYLIVDEAHGALYPFCDKLPQSAVKIADFTIQSLHKTAGGLNPTALLHTTCNIDLNTALSKISTTSPSYALLLTIEKNIAYLNSQKGRAKIEELIKNIQTLKTSCSNIEFFDGDITKLLIRHKNMTGFELSEKLFQHDIEDEKTNTKSTLLLCGIGTDKKKLERLKKVLKKL